MLNHYFKFYRSSKLNSTSKNKSRLFYERHIAPPQKFQIYHFKGESFANSNSESQSVIHRVLRRWTFSGLNQQPPVIIDPFKRFAATSHKIFICDKPLSDGVLDIDNRSNLTNRLSRKLLGMSNSVTVYCHLLEFMQ